MWRCVYLIMHIRVKSCFTLHPSNRAVMVEPAANELNSWLVCMMLAVRWTRSSACDPDQMGELDHRCGVGLSLKWQTEREEHNGGENLKP